MALFLTILKIIGIILLCLLAFLLVLFFLALFCPAVYRIKGEKQERLFFHMRISWLFPLLYGQVKYEEKLSCILYLLGIPVYNLLGEKSKKDEKPQKKKKRKKQEAYTDPATQQTFVKEIMQKSGASDNSDDVDDSEEKEPEKDREGEAKISVFQKAVRSIKEFFQKVKLFFQKVFEKVRNIKYTILNMKKKLENLKETIYWYKEVLEREESRRAITKGKQQILKFLKHIRPKKLKGNILFGFGDPGATGEALGFISMFYPLFGNHITIIPDFERTIFQGDFYVKGRIRAFNLLKFGWSIMFDKDIKNLYNILTGGKDHE
ncbi:MAG: DUF2953 domain-containing protein [Roseburia sp.]|nr:DUF2953 domain-containing protein [Roseburia sp.]MCM1279545.1 DUF2953 domain-containing protein [Robinsoniella sp.]